MKKLFVICSIIALCSFTTKTANTSTETKVWICSGSTTYHKSSSCIAIKNCEKATQVTTATAKNQGKTACGICYPKRKTSTSTSSSQATKSTKTTNQATKTTKSSTSNQATKTQATKTRK